MASFLRDTTSGLVNDVSETAKPVTDVAKDPVKSVTDVAKETATPVADLAKAVLEPVETTTAAVDKILNDLLSGLDKDTSKILHVYSHDRRAKANKEKTCIPLSNIKNGDLKLSDIRDLLHGENVLGPRLLWSRFCNQRGAIVQDTTSFKMYLQILHETVKTIGDATGDNVDSYRVYLKSKKTMEDNSYHAIVKKTANVDKDIKVFPTPTPAVSELPTNFSHNIFLNPTTTFNIVHPSDMSEKNWSVVMRSNSLLHSHRIVDLGDKGGKFVEKSLYPSFVLKPRSFWNYQISAATKVDSIAEQKQMIRVPRFRIDDDSYIRQYEQKKSVSRAISEACLTESDAKLAVEAGAFGFNVSASASDKESQSSSSTSNTSKETQIMTIIYNFPRVVIDFEPGELDLSDEMKKDLAKVDSSEGVNLFKNKYGRFFATRVQLGGRLHSSEETVSTDATSKSAQAKSMRAAAALSFSSPWIQASGSISHNESSSSGSENKTSASASTISWEAQGGDTLQCNNPPAWAYTVGSFYNWRVVQQTKVVPLEDMISMVPGYGATKEKFEAAQKKKTAVSLAQKTIKFRLSSKFLQGYHLTFPVSSKRDGYGEIVDKLVDRSAPLTDERLQFLSELTLERSHDVPLQLHLGEGEGTQQFAISTNTNDSKLKYNHPYEICVVNEDEDKSEERWLGVNKVFPGYVNHALVWAGKPQNSTIIEFHSCSFDKKGKNIEPGSPFTIVLYSREMEKLGYASFWARNFINDEKSILSGLPKPPFNVAAHMNSKNLRHSYTITYL